MEREEADIGRGRWGRDRELEEEPTLLQDSEPEKEGKLSSNEKNSEGD